MIDGRIRGIDVMIEMFKEAKMNNQILHIENFKQPEITWEDAVNFVYKETEKQNWKLEQDFKDSHRQVIGNVLLDTGAYFLPQRNDLHNVFKGVSEFMSTVNDGSNDDCLAYYDQENGCSCDKVWHIQGLRFCIGKRPVFDHLDPSDVLYWQLLGSSYWTMNNDKVYKLNPGDLFYFSKINSHAVHQDEPRVGIIINDFNDKL